MNEMNIGKGFLLVLIAGIISCAIWIGIISFTALGTGGAIGGLIAGGVGAIIAGVYQKGAGKMNFLGYLIIVIVVITVVIGALTLGTAFYLSNAGGAVSVGEAIDLIFSNRTLRFAFIQDALITGGIAVGMSIATTISSGKEKKKQED